MKVGEQELLAALHDVVAAREELVEERARRAAELLRTATARRWVGIYRVRSGQVENLGWSGVGPPAHPTFTADRGLTASVVATGQAVVANDVSADPRYLTNQATTGSELIVPVLSGGRVVGTVDVEDGSTGAFGAEDQRLFERAAAALVHLFTAPEQAAT